MPWAMASSTGARTPRAGSGSRTPRRRRRAPRARRVGTKPSDANRGRAPARARHRGPRSSPRADEHELDVVDRRRRTPRAGWRGSCAARSCRSTARTVARARAGRAPRRSGPRRRPRRRRPTARAAGGRASKPWATQSSTVACDGHEHERGVATGEVERALEEAQPVAGEVRRVVQEREVVHGHDERRGPRRHGAAGDVDDVDRPGGPLDRRPPERVPRLVERRPGQRQRLDRDGRRPRAGGGCRWRAATPTSSTSLVLERARRLDRRTGRAAGHRCQHCSRVTATRRPSPMTGESFTHGLEPSCTPSFAGDGAGRTGIGRLADHDRGRLLVHPTGARHRRRRLPREGRGPRPRAAGAGRAAHADAAPTTTCATRSASTRCSTN